MELTKYEQRAKTSFLISAIGLCFFFILGIVLGYIDSAYYFPLISLSWLIFAGFGTWLLISWPLYFVRRNQFRIIRALEEEYSRKKISFLGKEKGKWLMDMMYQLKPKYILQIGAGKGYVEMILSLSYGYLTLVEKDVNKIEEAKKHLYYFVKKGLEPEIVNEEEVSAVNSLLKDTLRFDLIFIDFDKEKYAQVLDDCVGLMTYRGYIIANDVNSDFRHAIFKRNDLETEFVKISGSELSVSRKIFSKIK